MADRDEVERKLSRAISRTSAAQFEKLLGYLGDPPNIANVPQDFWNKLSGELQAAIEPYIEDGYLQSANDLMESSSISTSWDVINQQAADWASRYTFDLVKDINANTMRGLQRSINWYYQASGRTIGDLERKISRWFSPQRAEMIAITEVTRASSEGQRQAKQDILSDNENLQAVDIWLTTNDELVCPVCGPRHNKEIKDGIYPPLHPRCKCTHVTKFKLVRK
jgi:hypothetical protein